MDILNIALLIGAVTVLIALGVAAIRTVRR